MHIAIAGKSVIRVRTRRIVHGVESEGCRREFKSGNSETGALAAAIRATMRPSMTGEMLDFAWNPGRGKLDRPPPTLPRGTAALRPQRELMSAGERRSEEHT